MEDILDHFEEEKKGIYEYDPNIVNEDNYLQLFWGQPRQAFGYLLNQDNKDSVIFLLGVTALIGMISGAGSFNYLRGFGIDNGFLVAAISGIANVALISILILFYFKIGQFLGGEGDLMAVATISLWASIPTYITSSIALIPSIFSLIGISTPVFLDGSGFLFTGAFGVVNFIVSIWGLILSVVGLSVAHKFSNGNAISTYLLSIVIFAIPIGILAYTFVDLYS